MQHSVTGQALPADAIQRVLFIVPKVHIYQIPPLTSAKGYTAAAWTANDNRWHIFTARLRVLETALAAVDGKETETPKTEILLEDPNTGDLFAAAPYTSEAVVEQALDSSRFFAIRVQGEGGRKAMLGLGFEDRSEAFDFGVCLQEVRRIQGLDRTGASIETKGGASLPRELPVKKDFSLKEGETITVKLRGKSPRARKVPADTPVLKSEGAALFAIPPPPYRANSDEGKLVIPPPPSGHNEREIRAEKRRSRRMEFDKQQAIEAGFDDGEFGEFQ